MDKPRLTLASLYNGGIHTHVKGRSAAQDTDCGVRLELHESSAYDGYENAQIDDIRLYRRNRFGTRSRLRWRANVRMTVRARFSMPAEEMSGTAGFGFWNAPMETPPHAGGRSLPSPPAATWFFFAGPNSNIAAAKGVPGWGWKAASIDTRNRRFLALLPAAPVAIPLMRFPAAYGLLWPVAQRAMRVDEKMLDVAMDEWHDYALTWTRESVRYVVDGVEVHVCHNPPRARMGFVAWIDNQYMVATPQGAFGGGVVPVERARSLEIAGLSVKRV